MRGQDCAWKIFPTRSDEESFPLNSDGGGFGGVHGFLYTWNRSFLLNSYEASLIPSFFLFGALPI